MNAEPNELQRRLELATSADPGPLDDETAALRESWLALGKLLQVAESPPRHSGLIETIELRTVSAGSRTWWWLALACAASAIIAVGLGFVVRSADRGEPQVANRQPSAGMARSGDLEEVPASPAISSIELAWEDDWDKSFAETAFVLQQIHGNRRPRDTFFSRLEGEFQQLAREFDSGSL
jgi:hypothetical protein